MWEKIIEWQARRQPNKTAIWTEDGAATFGLLAQHIVRTKTALEREDLPPGVVLIAVRHPALHWLLTFALERLGRTTLCEFSDLGTVAKMVGASVIVTTDPGVQVEGVRVLCADSDWRRRALTCPPSERRSEAAPDDLVRIVLSSGTTGERKQVPITRRIMDTRLGRPALGMPEQRLVSLQSLGVNTIGGFQQPLVTWLHGGTTLAPAAPTADIIAQQRPNAIPASPAQLLNLLPVLTQVFGEDEPISVVMGGSAAPPALLAALNTRANIQAKMAYGSTEGGSIANGPVTETGGRPGATGYLTPWTDLEIVDEAGKAVPTGQSGIIRVRGPGVVQGYLEGGVIQPFADGWFYPNDIGRLDADGMLVIDGRVDDVVNVGGLKLSATRVEETLLACPGVQDAAVTLFPMTSGKWSLHAAIVSANGYDPKELQEAVRRSHRADLTLTDVDVIPRNDMGKIVREAVRRAILAVHEPLAGRPEASA